MPLPLSFAALSLALSPLPQVTEAPADQPSPWFGSSASFAGDVDGDGREDLIVQDGGPPGGRRAWVLSGEARTVLCRVSGERDGRPLHGVGAVGDLDLDGHADLMVTWAGAEDRWKGGGLQHVRSGKDGELLVTFRASSVSHTADFDGDGRRDWIVRRFEWKEEAEDFGRHCLVSGATGEVLWQAKASKRPGHLGWGSTVVGNVDGDGLPDLADVARTDRVHELVVLSTRAEEPVLRVEIGSASCESYSLCGAGDLDGDGKDDVAIGRTVHCEPHPVREALLVRSGADGRVLLEVTDEAIGYGPEDLDWDADFGSGVARITDLDGDGVRDFLVGAESYSLGTGAFVLVSAEKGEVLQLEKAPPLGPPHGCVHFGSGLDAGADWDGDSTEDWLVTSGSITGGPGIGEVRIYSGATRALLESITRASIPE